MLLTLVIFSLIFISLSRKLIFLVAFLVVLNPFSGKGFVFCVLLLDVLLSLFIKFNFNSSFLFLISISGILSLLFFKLLSLSFILILGLTLDSSFLKFFSSLRV